MRTSLVLTIALLASLAFPALGAAKGPAAATMNGPGISGKHFPGAEGETGSPLWTLTLGAGFFQQAFGQVPDPTLPSRPAGSLGPRYTVTYDVPGPTGGDSVLRQDFYPYADAGPVTYMKPGQTFWNGQRAHGGWFVADRSLVRKLGLPAQPPTSGGAQIWRWSGIGVGLLLLASVVGLLLLRLRPRARPVSA